MALDPGPRPLPAPGSRDQSHLMTSTHPGEQTATRTPGVRGIALIVLLVGMVVGAVITAVTLAGDSPPSTSPSAQLARVESSCRDWNASQDGPDDERWCTDMFTWMEDRSGGSMMGSMMWRSPERMDRYCREWVDQGRADARLSGHQHCGLMVDWMNQHMPNRGGSWMMRAG